ncbi:MAG: hypothetical protein NC320_09075 [Clostridium sp.]|nr:hypothetical protein [Clostridium sp.]MCM1547921.1 hypothetical protein [Ruminococcus sp.]
MSSSQLLDSMAKKCVLMEKMRIPDGEGGWEGTQWKEGAEFNNYQELATSMEARIAEKEGVTSVYSALVDKALPIEYGDYFKDIETGKTYRVTSEPDEKKAPNISTLKLKYFTAEKKALPV